MWSSVFSCASATTIVANSTLLIVCLSGCDLTLVCMVVFVFEFTTPALRAGLPLTWEPSVYIKSRGVHFRLCILKCSILVEMCGWISVGMSLYVFLMLMICASNSAVSITIVYAICP